MKKKRNRVCYIIINQDGCSDTEIWNANYYEIKEGLKRGATGTFKIHKGRRGTGIILTPKEE